MKRWLLLLLVSLFLFRPGQTLALSVTAVPATNIVSETGIYAVVFTTGAAGTIKTVEMTFPAGFILSGAKLVEVAGLNPGTFSVSGQILTYIVTSDVNVPGNQEIRIIAGNIKNGKNNVAYTLSIKTKNAAGGTIEGPTVSNAFTLIKINAGMLANNSVNSIKIVDGSVATADLANGAVSGAKIGAGAVGLAQINTNEVQQRVGSVCSAGSSIRTINADGTVVCEADDTGGTASDLTCVGCVGSTDVAAGAVASAQIADGGISASDIAAGAIGNPQIADGAVTSAKIAVGAIGSAQLANGAVGTNQINDGSVGSSDVGFNYAGSATKGGAATDLSCVGCVSQTELNFSLPGKPARRIVVAASGGDYTTVSAALAAISPTATNPYVIDVMPGTYIENITMKDYVHLRGAGREVTTIQSPSTSSSVIYLGILSQDGPTVAITGLTITGGAHGIYNYWSSPTISGNTISGNGLSGIYNNYWSLPVIIGNMITGNGANVTIGAINDCAIYNQDYSSPTISGNTIIANRYSGIGNYSSSPTINGNTITWNGNGAIHNYSSSPTIYGNMIKWNGSNGFNSPAISNNISFPAISGNMITNNNWDGIYNYSSSPVISDNTITWNGHYGTYDDYSWSQITHNRITDNGGSTYTDIFVTTTSTPNISFNVYNDITGTSGVGMYNVNTGGGVAPAP